MPFRRLLPLAALLSLPFQLLAQGTADTGSFSRTPEGRDSAAAGSPANVIRGVVIERRDIFDPGEQSWVARVANGLHIMTRPGVVRRELLFRPGEPYDSARVAESERNLRALGVFRRVMIDTVRTDTGLVVRVTTKDGWSTKADWRFRSAGGQVAFTIGLVEDNLLGTAASSAVRYRKDPDRSTVALSFKQSRLIANTVGLGLLYEDRSDGRDAWGAVERPFHSLTSTHGFRLEAEDEKTRVLRFFEGEEVASDTLTRRYAFGRASAALALRSSTSGFLRVGLSAQIRRDDYLPEGSTAPFPSTVTGAVGPYLIYNEARFLVTRGFAGFAREEDVDLGLTLRLGLLAAPKLFGYERDGLGPELAGRVGAMIPAGFAHLDAAANGLFTSAGLDSGSVQLGTTVAIQPGPQHMAVFHLEAGWIKNPRPGAEFDLGLGEGPRAFRSHAFTGDRSVFATAEYRWTMAPDLFGLVGLGIAGFVDHGGAWYAGSRRRLGWDAGVGLRLGPSRTTDTDALRFDLAYRFENDVEPGGWVVTVGKGFVFSALSNRGL